MKQCSECKLLKEDSEFDYGRTYCKDCRRAKRRAYYAANPESEKKARRLYAKANPAKLRAGQRKYLQKIRLEVLIYYGGIPPKCVCCGESNLGFLTIDHINGKGRQERLKLGYEGFGSRFYCWLRRSGYPEGYQVLCYNCNCGRAKNNGICPHKKSLN